MHDKISTLKRFTAFLLTLCCIFSMFPTMTPSAAAAPAPAEDVQYRYVWLISQPGIQVRFRNDDPENPPEVAMMEEHTSSAKWFPMKEIPDPNNPGKQIWVVDPDSYEYTTKYKVPQPGAMGADRNDIGLLRVSTHFNQTTRPRPDAWPNAEFVYDTPRSKSFNPNEIDESNHDTNWWAGNITGGTVCKTYPDMDDWKECIDPMPFDSKMYFPSSLWTQSVQNFAPTGDTFYYIQFQLRSDDLPKLAEILKTTGDSQFEYGNNSMFRFVSTEKLGMPNFDNQGTVIFDFNLPGHEASVDYLEKAGTMVSVPGVTTQQVDGVTFKFKGWYDKPTGGTKLTASQVEVPKGTYQVYYAQWDLVVPTPGVPSLGKGDMYVGYFDYNIEGAGVTSAYCAAGTFTWTVTVDGKSKTYTAKLPFQFPEAPYRKGYTFLGWASSPTATVPDRNNSWLPTEGDNTVYGVWEANMHTLTWDANGGNGGTTTNQRFNEEIKAPAAKPTREGFTFGGWYQDKQCSVPLG